MRPTDNDYCGCGLTVKEIMVRRQRAKNEWLTSLNNNRRRWKVPS